MKQTVIGEIREKFNICLDQERYQDKVVERATLKQMFDILEPTLPTERIKYRERVADIYEARRSFVSLDVAERKRKSPASFDKNPDICFQHLEYTVNQSQLFCEVTIVKHVDVDYSFFIQTKNGSAKSPGDFQAIDELVTMKSHEDTRQIQVLVADDAEVEPDEDFEIHLLNEITKERLPGDDTRCRVTITENAGTANVLGFQHRIVKVLRSDKVCTLWLERANCQGELTCQVMTSSDPSRLEEFGAIAQPKTDY